MYGKSDIHLIYWTDSTSAGGMYTYTYIYIQKGYGWLTIMVLELKQEKVYSVRAPVEGPTGHMNHNHIREIALSPSDGKRLAVVFEKSDCVALYSVQLESMPTLARKDILQHM